MVHKRLTGTVFFFLVVISLNAKVPGWEVSSIPDSLKENALAVIRDFSMVYDVSSLESAKYSIRKVVTIFNRNAEDLAAFELYYDNFRSIESLNATLYNAAGIAVRSYKQRDFFDLSAVSDGNLFQDDRKKVLVPQYSQYPYTVEYKYEVSLKSTYLSPSWMPVDNYNTSLQQASFELKYNPAVGIRFKEFNMDSPPEKSFAEGKQCFYWTLKSFKAYTAEAFVQSYYEILPVVLCAPSEFILNGYEGNMDSWKNYGLWQYKVNIDRDKLPAETILKIQSLVNDAADKRETVKRIYQYMQRNTRYVSIQLGIGGLQPFEASQVDRTGYGDCKALVNYTKALLKVAGIDAIYTLVRAGADALKTIEDFPSDQFNHIILCVPLERDTIWLECTDPTQPFGYLGQFTDDRKALLVTREGGFLVNTPVYGEKENRQITQAKFLINPQGGGTLSFIREGWGVLSESYYSLSRENKESQRKRLYEIFNLPGFEIDQYSFQYKGETVPGVNVSASISLSIYSTNSGRRMFLPLNTLSRLSYIPPKNEDRVADVYIPRAKVYMDTLRFDIPSGFTIEYLPEPRKYSSIFGNFESAVFIEGSGLVYTRSLKWNKCRAPAQSYIELMRFFKDVMTADGDQVVLLRN